MSQQELFYSNEGKVKKLPLPISDNTFLHNQLIKLGDMIGDGLHNEPDGRWIEKEYKKIAKIVIPELREQEKERRKKKAIHIDEQMIKLLSWKKCDCGGNLKQSRSGSKVGYCEKCNARWVAKYKK